MPKVTNPLFSGDARGKFGNLFIFTKGGQVRRYFKPRNPNTPAQQAVRQAFKEFSVPSLTQEQADLLYAMIQHLHDDRYSQLEHSHNYASIPQIFSHAPVIRQFGEVIPYTLTLSKYQVFGKKADWMFRFDFTGAGGEVDSDNRIDVTLPVVAFYSVYDLLLSSTSFYDVSAGTFYDNKLVVLNGSGNSFAVTPGAVRVAAGDSFFGYITYFLP